MSDFCQNSAGFSQIYTHSKKVNIYKGQEIILPFFKKLESQVIFLAFLCFSFSAFIYLFIYLFREEAFVF
jgi:hypothetical protein